MLIGAKIMRYITQNIMKKIKYRLIAEIFGLVFLFFITFQNKDLIVKSWQTVQNSNLSLVLICLSLTWLGFLWSSISYKILTPVKINLFYMYLTNLAASGPGRVVPGGAGYLSFGILFLRKQSVKTQKAIAIAATNNIFGFVINLLIMAVIIYLNPGIIPDLKISLQQILIVALVFALILIGFYVLNKLKYTKKIALSSKKEFLAVFKSLKNIKILLPLIVTMLATISTNSAILYFAGHSINLPISFFQAVIVMSIGSGAGSLIPTPGGVGGVEAGLAATLILFGFDHATAGATVLIYRTATYIQPIVPGIASYLYLRYKNIL